MLRRLSSHLLFVRARRWWGSCSRGVSVPVHKAEASPGVFQPPVGPTSAVDLVPVRNDSRQHEKTVDHLQACPAGEGIAASLWERFLLVLSVAHVLGVRYLDLALPHSSKG